MRPLVAWLQANRWLVLATELLFLVVLVGWAAFRAYNPDIAGTEKPMEFAFVNGILRSPLFPPQDPWLSGYGISYYYFGYVMLAALVNLTGVDPGGRLQPGRGAVVRPGDDRRVRRGVRPGAVGWKLEAGNWKPEAGS